jgi:hypothetical protein
MAVRLISDRAQPSTHAPKRIYDQAHTIFPEVRELPGNSHEPAVKIAWQVAVNPELDRKSTVLRRHNRQFCLLPLTPKLTDASSAISACFERLSEFLRLSSWVLA